MSGQCDVKRIGDGIHGVNCLILYPRDVTSGI